MSRWGEGETKAEWPPGGITATPEAGFVTVGYQSHESCLLSNAFFNWTFLFQPVLMAYNTSSSAQSWTELEIKRNQNNLCRQINLSLCQVKQNFMFVWRYNSVSASFSSDSQIVLQGTWFSAINRLKDWTKPIMWALKGPITIPSRTLLWRKWVLKIQCPWQSSLSLILIFAWGEPAQIASLLFHVSLQPILSFDVSRLFCQVVEITEMATFLHIGKIASNHRWEKIRRIHAWKQTG